MQPVVTDRVAWSVRRSVTLVSPAKTAAPIEMPFGLRTPWWAEGTMYKLDEGSGPPWEGAILRGERGVPL